MNSELSCANYAYALACHQKTVSQYTTWKIVRCSPEQMMKRDLVVASTRQHRARLLECYPRPPFAPSFVKSRAPRPLISYFFNCNNRYSLSLYVYTRGMLGCLLGFWLLVQNPAWAIISTPVLCFLVVVIDE